MSALLLCVRNVVLLKLFNLLRCLSKDEIVLSNGILVGNCNAKSSVFYPQFARDLSPVWCGTFGMMVPSKRDLTCTSGVIVIAFVYLHFWWRHEKRCSWYVPVSDVTDVTARSNPPTKTILHHGMGGMENGFITVPSFVAP
jgi:hypothetical protein